MTLEQLIDQFRADADDEAVPPLFSDDWLALVFTEAQQEAAIRARLILEDSDPAMCEIPLEAGDAHYELNALMYELVHTAVRPSGSTERRPVHLRTREWLDENLPHWRDLPADDRTQAIIQDDARIRLVPAPRSAGTLLLEGYRLPLRDLRNPGDRPEIHSMHHAKLVHWALYRAFARPDGETMDRERAARELADFTAYFGLRPDADARRATRSDQEHHNQAFMP